jgi:hypothetical protein
VLVNCRDQATVFEMLKNSYRDVFRERGSEDEQIA